MKCWNNNSAGVKKRSYRVINQASMKKQNSGCSFVRIEVAARPIVQHSCVSLQTKKKRNKTQRLGSVKTCGSCNYSRNIHSEKIIP